MSNLKEDIIVGIFFLLGAKLPWIIIYYMFWVGGFYG